MRLPFPPLLLLSAGLWLAGGCETKGVSGVGNTTGSTPEEGTDSGQPGETSEVLEIEEAAPAARADLRLKRWRQLQLDLEGGLLLTSDEICKEAGLYDCTVLHVVPLGGVSVQNGLYRSVDTVPATAQLAMERVVLAACASRVKADLSLDEPVVFTEVDLHGTEAPEAEALAAQIIDLSRRLLARSPVLEEVEALSTLHATVTAEGGTTADWALLSCFALGTTTEALTY